WTVPERRRAFGTGRDMDRIVLATSNTEFEARLRDVFGEDLDGGVTSAAVNGGSADEEITRLMAGKGGVLGLGPDLPEDRALELAAAADRSGVPASVVIIAPPSPQLLYAALRAGARDVLAPGATDIELREGFGRALDAARIRRDGSATDASQAETRVITVLCAKGGAGKTTVATNVAAGLTQQGPGEAVIVDL